MPKKEKSIDLTFICVDCGNDTYELGEVRGVCYEVKGKFVNAGAHPSLPLCLKCVEHRIDRKLNFRDFTKAPQNMYIWPVHRSDRLQRRMGFL